MHKSKKKTKNSGFTLIELLVVISVIGLLSSVILVSINSARKKANDARRQADTRQIAKAYELYYADHNKYPYAAGTLPAAALLPYAAVIPTAFTAGPNSYFALSRSPGDPNTVGISDDGSGCVKIKDGFVVAVGISAPDQYSQNDGGLEPSYYEAYGGDYQLFKGSPGTYSSSNPC